MRNVDADHLLEEIKKLEKTDWYLKGSGTCDGFTEKFKFDGRREAVEVIVELCIKREPIVEVTDDRLAKFEKAMKEAPKFFKPCEYPIRKFKVVAKGTLGLVDHYVYADDVSEDENGCHFWIDDKKVGHFTNAVAYYEVKKNESDTNRE